MSSNYIGRFAPSPSGPLHFGSLVAALASFLDARANDGKWLMRMEDLDPSREPAGVADLILEQTRAFGMDWDGDVLYQSSRIDAYHSAIATLTEAGHCYRCDCSRAAIKAAGSVYQGLCADRELPPIAGTALRVRCDDEAVIFEDGVQGPFSQHVRSEVGDFIILRKDSLVAYQLAVVVDDAYQEISHVIRGCDLLDSTPRQIHLQRLLGATTPCYAHIPVVVNELGQKLSKQHFAEPLPQNDPQTELLRALHFLGMKPPSRRAFTSVEQVIAWAIDNWDIQLVAKLATIPHDYSFG